MLSVSVQEPVGELNTTSPKNLRPLISTLSPDPLVEFKSTSPVKEVKYNEPSFKMLPEILNEVVPEKTIPDPVAIRVSHVAEAHVGIVTVALELPFHEELSNTTLSKAEGTQVPSPSLLAMLVVQ